MIELLKNRRSIRRYTQDKIKDDEINLIVKAGLLAPSSRSIKPWEFIIVDNKEVLIKLSKCRTKGGGPFLKSASHGIVVIVDESKSDVIIEDASIAAILMQLQAERLGIGSCWIQVRNREHDDNLTAEEYIKNLLNIPGNYKVEAIISLGYPDEIKEPYKEEELEYNKIHINKY